MSIAICHDCGATIDTDNADYSTTPSNHIICEDCAAVYACEDNFTTEGRCICGEHTVCRAEPDVGIFEPYLELRA